MNLNPSPFPESVTRSQQETRCKCHSKKHFRFQASRLPVAKLLRSDKAIQQSPTLWALTLVNWYLATFALAAAFFVGEVAFERIGAVPDLCGYASLKGQRRGNDGTGAPHEVLCTAARPKLLQGDELQVTPRLTDKTQTQVALATERLAFR